MDVFLTQKTNIDELTIHERRQIWLKRNQCTLSMLAKAAGVSVSVLSRTLRSPTMPTARHGALVAFGVPSELLPEPVDKKPGPKPVPEKVSVAHCPPCS